jgi:hypothetical protein
MTPQEIDALLTGIIILLLMIVFWKIMKKNSVYKTNNNDMNLSCRCRGRVCRCQGRVRNTQPVRGGCYINSELGSKNNKTESFANKCTDHNSIIGTPGYQEKIVDNTGDFSGDMIQKLSLDPEIIKSQKEYINGFGFSGLPTGSSHDTTLEETGRSYGTADFVGLTQRKFCKARQLAKPTAGARFVPSETIKEWCDIDMNELI